MLRSVLVAATLVFSSALWAREDHDKGDPFNDKVITCQEMRRYPKQIFEADIDLGSGHGSPINVDYGCPESLASLTFLKRLHRLTKTIRSDGGPQQRTGSIIHAQWRYYHFDLLKAGFAPDIMLQQSVELRKRGDPTSYLAELDSYKWKYFERWSYESLYNRRLYLQYLAELNRVTPLLAAHYQRQFSFPKKKARVAAERALEILLGRAAGSSPRDRMEETESVLLIARRLESSSGLSEFLESAPGPDSLRRALNIALLKGRPRSDVERIVERMPSLDVGDESPLFFAVQSVSDVRFLLDHGASVDYPNPFGKTVLYYAIGRRDIALVKLLIERGADVNQRYRVDLNTPEMKCMFNIEHTARIPLMHAAQHADPAMMTLLLERGARFLVPDGVDFNAADYAMIGRKPANAAYLATAGIAPLQTKRWDYERKYNECEKEADRKKVSVDVRYRFLGACLERP